MDEDVAIKVEGVYKNFRLPHQREDSIKRHLLNSLRHRNRGFVTQSALQDINFEVKKGEFFGILGRNGSGKSTLLKIISDIYQPTKGRVQRRGKLVAFIELGVGFNPELTGRENVYLNGALLGFSRKEIDDMYEDIVEFSELSDFMEQKLKNYSSGMTVRLAFSVAIRAKADILILDEVLAVGDAAFQRKCFDYFDEIKQNGTTVVFVSHSMDSVRKYCDKALLIEDSRIVGIGDSEKIATLYSKLFVKQDDNKKNKSKKLSPSGEERWGDGLATWHNVTAEPQYVDNPDEPTQILITAQGKASADIEHPIFGFSIKDNRFRQLVGTNTERIQVKMKPIRKGESFSVNWLVPNVLNSDRYHVDCTIAHDQADQVSDRWPEATDFVIERLSNNPYPLFLSDIAFESSLRKGRHEKDN